MSSAPASQQTRFLGLRFDDLEQSEAIERIKRLAQADSFHYVVTPNVDHIVRLHSRAADAVLRESYAEASICLCDSRILRALAALSGIRLSLVTGSDLTIRLLDGYLDKISAITVIGGAAGVIEDVRRRYPACSWHHHLPPMGVRDNPEAQEQIIEFVQRTGADLMLFAIGSPQSELLCHEIRRRGSARGVALCIGASLEFVSGAKKRAPPWMQRAGLEWFFRLVCEPRRLWRRYLVQGPAIFPLWGRSQLTRVLRRDESGSRPSDEP
jgi:exopolysaccharide biosynthesis WecB/TagA/CpsF family protein